MRIRKVFESRDFYQTVNNWTYANNIISSVDRDKLIEIFPQLRKPIENGQRTSNSKVIYGVGDNRIDIDIKIDNDEYFYIRLAKKVSSSLPNPLIFYKCDQWDGLIECIENEVINKYILNED